mmetsp:Transcript_12000/g.25561  ORF Transcript_12000/g.25561 Transcript_12000/m.25561 type:complete len:703 (-) Transcript_12000:279-2387(-)|eukprot:CAMPEP_0183736458 /NCGR_PEP_ID=MMETSP0737-20130205/49311_1 /TAXON_ID=385413 /ORGANISM="Thalassiosira miniscula, Strain CCMP1093" /LENGTH=702 /DNA_ID=CAMNT_0025970467 /DNA_START=45 /DNA_END=2153 /DNA_ORIENTATION=-
MASSRRSERELAEARASGNAPPEVDVKTGAMINPHNPEFITKKPWYLAEGGDGGPTLDHQADQRREEDKRGISLGEADRLVREERDRIKRKLERQKKRGKKRRSHEEEADLFEVGMWIEALRKNKKPYLIAQIVKISGKGSKCGFDLKYEDGYIERNVRPWAEKKKSSFLNAPRMRVTRTGSRTASIHNNAFGKETYDSKRDSYHGVEIDGHMKKMENKYLEREALRKEQRQAEREQEEKEDKEKQQQQQQEGGGEQQQGRPSDSDSDYDSDVGGNEDGFSSSEDEVLQTDKDAKLFTSRLARQGGVGGAQMKVTARNLRIREDTAKYLRNLDPNSAYYDPKSRSMRDNPYANNAGGDDGNDAAAQQRAAAESLGFAGDNFSRISGDAVKLAETQLFAWDAEKKIGMEGAVHIQADPSRAELMKRKVESRGKDVKERKRRAVLDRYGGEEYLDASSGAKAGRSSGYGNGGANAPPKETPEERATRFGVSHAEQEYGRDGRLASSATTGSAKQKKRVAIPCKYEEDVHTNGHTAVWGSYFHKGAFKWGFADDHSLIRSSYGTGANGRIANDESNELQYGSGAAGSAMLASARKMLEVIPKAKGNVARGGDENKPNQQSKLYGEAVDQHKEYDKDKLRVAMKRQEEQEAGANNGKGGNGKRKYNSLSAEVDITEEDMEAYRLRKGRGTEDPMANLGGELLDYKK